MLNEEDDEAAGGVAAGGVAIGGAPAGAGTPEGAGIGGTGGVAIGASINLKVYKVQKIQHLLPVPEVRHYLPVFLAV